MPTYGFAIPEPENEVTWARGREPHRTYIARSFPFPLAASQDYGEPARYLTKVFDPTVVELDLDGPDLTVEEFLVHTTPAGRKQIQLQVVRERGNVRQLVLQEVPTSHDAKRLKTLLKLDRDGSRRLMDFIRVLDTVPVEGDKSVRIDDEVLEDFFRDPSAMTALYDRHPEAVRRLIEVDTEAEDVFAISRRRATVRLFRRLLEDPEFFEKEVFHHGGSRESVWQTLFEAEPWLLGANLVGQLTTKWNAEKLEQVVRGFSIGGPGKRTDALLRTNGRIRSMVFAEIKHHQTPLVDDEYRRGCWAPSPELSGGVVQIQQTVHLATREINGRIADLDETGAETAEDTYLVRPRSFLVVGSLEQLRSDTGVHRAKYESFELYRRNLYEPEIITFDELLARAEWQCSLLEPGE